MKVTLYGATGKTGSRILTELLARGHQIKAVSREPASFPPSVGTAIDDLSRTTIIVDTIAGSDAVVSAYAPPSGNTDAVIGVVERLIAAFSQSGPMRLVVVGGAGSLEVAPGVTLEASGHLPPEWLAIAHSHAEAFALLKASSINWTYISPSAFFEPGERTGKFRIGTDQLLANETGDSRISMEDYAIALVDELERPAFERKRFTVGY